MVVSNFWLHPTLYFISCQVFCEKSFLGLDISRTRAYAFNKGERMRILVACEFSGIVREAFKAKGHDAWSCDLLLKKNEAAHFKESPKQWLINGGTYEIKTI
jgi:hypothetical protein